MRRCKIWATDSVVVDTAMEAMVTADSTADQLLF